MNKFWQKEIGGVLGAVLITSSCTPAVAGEYQRGYSHERTCFKSEYREEYIPGTENSPGYVKSWKDTVEVPCQLTVDTSLSASILRNCSFLL